MASIVLGVAGAAVGSVFGGPAGAYKGFQIGSLVGSILSQPHSQQGLVNDLRYSGSSFGATIPRIWGKGKIGTNIMWTSKDSSGNTLVQHTHDQSILGGGSGGLLGGGQSTYTYSATFAGKVCVGTHTFPDGTQQFRPVTLLAIWLDDQLAYSSGAVQTLSMNGSVTAGTFTLTYGGNTTGPLYYNALASEVQTALQALSSIGPGNVLCTGGALPYSPVQINFTGSLSGITVSNITISSSLAGGNAQISSVNISSLPLKLGTNLFWHDGSETQTADPLISANVGSANAPAYRGMAYYVLENLDLSNYGNRIPSVQVEVDTGPVYASDIISDLCRASGLSLANLDTSSVTTTLVTGLVEGNQNAAIDTINSLLLAYQLDLIDVDGVLRLVPRGGVSTSTPLASDFGAAFGNKQDPITLYRRDRLMKWDLPGTYQVNYFDINANYEAATQQDIRQTGNLQNVVSVSLPISTDATTARHIAAQQLDNAWTEQDSFEFYLPSKYIAIAPADILTIPTVEGTTQRVRVEKLELAVEGLLHITAVPDIAANTIQVATGGTGSGPTIGPTATVPTEWTQWSGFEVRDTDQAYPGIYIAAAATSGNTGWKGCTVYYSFDGTNFTAGPLISQASPFGVTTSVLSASGAVASTFDTSNTFGVDLTNSNGALASVSNSEVLAGTNHALVGNEIMGVGTASLTSLYHYTLSNLRRGERSSVMTGHVSGERFIGISSSLQRIQFTDSQVGSLVYIKCVSPGQALSDVTPQTCTILARTPTALETTVAGIHTSSNYLATPTSVVTLTNATLAWTSYSGPAGASEVLLESVLSDTSAQGVILDGRPTGSSNIYHLNSTVSASTEGGYATNQAWVQIGTGGKFDLRVTTEFGGTTLTCAVRVIAYR